MHPCHMGLVVPTSSVTVTTAKPKGPEVSAGLCKFFWSSSRTCSWDSQSNKDNLPTQCTAVIAILWHFFIEMHLGIAVITVTIFAHHRPTHPCLWFPSPYGTANFTTLLKPFIYSCLLSIKKFAFLGHGKKKTHMNIVYPWVFLYQLALKIKFLKNSYVACTLKY